jgi:hypothetical protein
MTEIRAPIFHTRCFSRTSAGTGSVRSTRRPIRAARRVRDSAGFDSNCGLCRSGNSRSSSTFQNQTQPAAKIPARCNLRPLQCNLRPLLLTIGQKLLPLSPFTNEVIYSREDMIMGCVSDLDLLPDIIYYTPSFFYSTIYSPLFNPAFQWDNY